MTLVFIDLKTYYHGAANSCRTRSLKCIPIDHIESARAGAIGFRASSAEQPPLRSQMPDIQQNHPTIAITMGDPAGIGAEVIVKALKDPDVARLAYWCVVGNSQVLDRAQSQTACELPASPHVRTIESGDSTVASQPPGKVSVACGRAALKYIETATQLCLEGTAQALVTAPVNKEAAAQTGTKFYGHTEFIASLCGVREPRMLLTSDRMRVVHVTTHVSLRQACELDHAGILRTIELGNESLRFMGLDQPRIAVCGLNPHAGENGLFGDEDALLIRPAVELARDRGILCHGPVPADTVYLKAVKGEYDLVVAMYHDQGHIPMKLLDFENTVNVTLGLPIIRTSVDHGTAFDIVGQNKANPGNMKAALRLAAKMASHWRVSEAKRTGRERS